MLLIYNFYQGTSSTLNVLNLSNKTNVDSFSFLRSFSSTNKTNYY